VDLFGIYHPNSSPGYRGIYSINNQHVGAHLKLVIPVVNSTDY